MKHKLKIFIVVAACSVLGISLSQGDLNKKKNRPGVVCWHGNPMKKQVALTFDDGPNEPYTSEILDILKEENVRATFFLVGRNVDRYPKIAKRMVEEGHIIGNHSYDHNNMVLQTDGQVRKEILSTETAIKRATGVHPTLFRPPFGGDDPLTFLQTERLGYLVVKWSVSSKDWKKPGATKIVSNVLARVENGSIVLMHDGDKLRISGDRSQTVEALPQLIHELRDLGYDLVTVPEILELGRLAKN